MKDDKKELVPVTENGIFDGVFITTTRMYITSQYSSEFVNFLIDKVGIKLDFRCIYIAKAEYGSLHWAADAEL